MLSAAKQLRRRGYSVEFDMCDSSIEQLRLRLKSRRPMLVLVGVWQFLAHLLSPTLPMIYISSKDLSADRWLNLFRSTRLVGAATPLELDSLPDVVLPLTRISMGGDLNSFHNANGLADLVGAVRVASICLPVDLYGPAAPAVELPPGVTYRGWAKRVSDLYEGDTVVFVSNVAGSGRPNKLLEAVACRRPIIVHESLASEVSGQENVHFYSNRTDLSRLLERLASA
jgi:hypothetical protein